MPLLSTDSGTIANSVPPPVYSSSGILGAGAAGATTSTALPYQQLAAQPTSVATPGTTQQQNPSSLLQTGINQAASSSKIGQGILGSVTNSINSFGNSALGFGLGANSTAAASTYASAPSLVDASSAAVSSAAPAWTSATLSGTLGAAGIGYIGGGYLAGVLGENQTGGSIGGALGAGIGMTVGGPVGAVVGGLAGSVLGGLFGGNNKPSDMTQVGGIGFNSGMVQTNYQNNESSTGSKFSQTNADLRNTAQQGAANLASYLLANGATYTPPAGNKSTSDLIIKVGSRDGYQVGTMNSNGQLNYNTTLPSGSNPTKLFDAVSQQVLSNYTIPDSLRQQIAGLNSNQFYQPDYDPSKVAANNSTNAATISSPQTTPQIAPTTSVAPQGGSRGILQIPNNTTG